MKNTLTVLVAAAGMMGALGAGVFGSLSCGGGGTGGGTGGGSSGTGGGSGGGSGGSSGATCASYCSSIAACAANPDGGTTFEQYKTNADCLGSCAGFTQGTAGATSGNNLECRAYHAGVAAGTGGDKALHCPHAGPAGDGACGTNCEGFCDIAARTCPGTFADAGVTCATACAAYTGVAARYNDSSTAGNSYACRMYHLTVASGSASAAATHCPHIIPASSTCQ